MKAIPKRVALVKRDHNVWPVYIGNYEIDYFNDKYDAISVRDLLNKAIHKRLLKLNKKK